MKPFPYACVHTVVNTSSSVTRHFDNRTGCCVRVIQYFDYISVIFDVLMYTFWLMLVKHGVLTLVGEIRRYRNDYDDDDDDDGD